jgi:hypothetical protein
VRCQHDGLAALLEVGAASDAAVALLVDLRHPHSFADGDAALSKVLRQTSTEGHGIEVGLSGQRHRAGHRER